MPTAPPRPCADPTCSELVLGGGRCSRHQTEQTRGFNQRRDPVLTRFYSSPAWKKARRAQLLREPVCRICGAPATDADHIRAMHDGGAPLDRSNLQSLCSAHHDRKSGRERRARSRRSRASTS